MTDDEFKRLRATMPWTEFSTNTGRQTLIRIIDNSGAEVPLLTLVAFSIKMSQYLTRQKEEKNA